ncbi:MAG TPA: DUF1572 family protein [Bacillota bacterium]|nr:DUF1572 family protein [Bacillota bacterium]
MELGNEYLNIVRGRFENVKTLGDKTISQLSEPDLHWTLNNSSNSIAVIIKHLSGNMISRWTDLFTSDGEKTFRNRDREFEEDHSSRQKLLEFWENGWGILLETMDNLDSTDLLKTVTIRGENHTVVEAIERQMAHYAYHVGQMVYIGKQVKGDEWKTLSIPKGRSDEYLQQKLNKHGRK